jgi:hypothetical protein
LAWISLDFLDSLGIYEQRDHGQRDHWTTAAGKRNGFSRAGDFEFLWSDLIGCCASEAGWNAGESPARRVGLFTTEHDPNNRCNLDRKNPSAEEDITHLLPAQLAADILNKWQRIAEIMGNIQNLLAKKAGNHE